MKGKKNSFFIKADQDSLIFLEMAGIEKYICSMLPNAMMEVLDNN